MASKLDQCHSSSNHLNFEISNKYFKKFIRCLDLGKQPTVAWNSCGTKYLQTLPRNQMVSDFEVSYLMDYVIYNLKLTEP